jgi:hypothetical protein
MSASRSIWVRPEAVDEILAFVRTHTRGIAVATLIAKYDLVSDQTLRVALTILESEGKIRIEHGDEYTVHPLNSIC